MSWFRPIGGQHRTRSGIGCAAVLLAFLGLGGCGFQPLYGGRDQNGSNQAAGNTISDMAYVAVAPISDRVGQLVRNRLLERLHPRGKTGGTVFRLTVSLDESQEGLAFEQDDSATRFNLNLRAHFQLIDVRDGSTLMSGTTRAIAAYNVVRSDYANLISQRDARNRAALAVADGIESRVAVYFSRRRS
jgi:LPS-assembly lipoprotein